MIETLKNRAEEYRLHHCHLPAIKAILAIIDALEDEMSDLLHEDYCRWILDVLERIDSTCQKEDPFPELEEFTAIIFQTMSEQFHRTINSFDKYNPERCYEVVTRLLRSYSLQGNIHTCHEYLERHYHKYFYSPSSNLFEKYYPCKPTQPTP